MAPSVEQTHNHDLVDDNNQANGSTTKSSNSGPLQKTGVLDSAHDFDEVTPVIGREYPTANIVDDLLNSPNADELLRDLAITSKSCLYLTTISNQSINQCMPWQLEAHHFVTI